MTANSVQLVIDVKVVKYPTPFKAELLLVMTSWTTFLLALMGVFAPRLSPLDPPLTQAEICQSIFAKCHVHLSSIKN